MYQEVQATIVLTYSADATLSRAELLATIRADVARLMEPGDPLHELELVDWRLGELREEAQIYDADEVTS